MKNCNKNFATKVRWYARYFSLAFLYLFFILSIHFLNPAFVDAQATSGAWVNAFGINVDGRRYTDIDPFDSERRYEDSAGGNCVGESDITDINGANTVGQFQFKFQDERGDCITRDRRALALQDAQKAKQVGNRISENEIEVYFPTNRGDSNNSYNQFELKVFRKGTRDAGTNVYRLVEGNGDLSTEIWIRVLNDKELRITFEGASRSGGFDTNFNGKGFRLSNSTVGGPTGGGEDGGIAQDDSCDVNFNNPLSWVLCPVILILESAVNTFYTLAENALNYSINPDAESALKNAWGAMRNIANIIFIISFLIIIISQIIIGRA